MNHEKEDFFKLTQELKKKFSEAILDHYRNKNLLGFTERDYLLASTCAFIDIFARTVVANSLSPEKSEKILTQVFQDAYESYKKESEDE